MRIDRPCGEAWDGMAPRGAARFCASCQKHVHDLGAMTALEVRALLSRGGACVRATVDRAGRIVVAPAAFGLLAGSSAVAPGDSPAACAPWWDRLADAAVIWWNGPADVPSFGTNEVTDEVVQLLTQLGYANSDDRDVATWMRLVEGHPAQRARLTCEDGVRVVPLPPGVGVAVPPGCGPQNLVCSRARESAARCAATSPWSAPRTAPRWPGRSALSKGSKLCSRQTDPGCSRSRRRVTWLSEERPAPPWSARVREIRSGAARTRATSTVRSRVRSCPASTGTETGPPVQALKARNVRDRPQGRGAASSSRHCRAGPRRLCRVARSRAGRAARRSSAKGTPSRVARRGPARHRRRRPTPSAFSPRSRRGEASVQGRALSRGAGAPSTVGGAASNVRWTVTARPPLLRRAGRTAGQRGVEHRQILAGASQRCIGASRGLGPPNASAHVLRRGSDRRASERDPPSGGCGVEDGRWQVAQYDALTAWLAEQYPRLASGGRRPGDASRPAGPGAGRSQPEPTPLLRHGVLGCRGMGE